MACIEQTINETMRSKRLKKMPRVIAGTTEFYVLQNTCLRSDCNSPNLYALAPSWWGHFFRAFVVAANLPSNEGSKTLHGTNLALVKLLADAIETEVTQH